MLKRLINYFAHNHLLINFIFFITLAGGVYFWTVIGKEALPNVEFNFVSISASYPGAAAEDVETFVTRPIENSLKSVEGIERVTSTSFNGSSYLSVDILNTADLATTVEDIRTAVLGVNLPSGIRNAPSVRQFKTSQRAVIDVAIFNTNYHLLDFEGRSELQSYVRNLEGRLTSLAAVSAVSISGDLKKRYEIELIPEKIKEYEVPINTVLSKLNSYDLKRPLGRLDDDNGSDVVVASTDYNPEELKKIIIRGTYLNPEVTLGDIANIYRDFEESSSIMKVNGYEGVIFNITKSTSYGIIKAVEKIKEEVERFKKQNPQVNIVYLDDESTEVRNRISLIGYNGMIGFALILLILFFLLDLNSGFWVAMGIPFTFGFTMAVAYFLGFSINNVTLAGVIIVMGMIVDDAIIVAENIVRKKRMGVPRYQAVVEGTVEMLLPITASVITTCIAFLPIYIATEGRFSQMVAPIPVMVTIMLIASLMESLFLLPGHMNYTLTPGWMRFFSFFKRKKFINRKTALRDWFTPVEDFYKKSLLVSLRYRYLIFVFFVGILGLSGYHLFYNMNFVLFPNEETREVYLTGRATKSKNQIETADMALKVEEILRSYEDEVISFRTDISRSRRGRAVGENEFSVWVELVPKEERDKALNQLTQEWEKAFNAIPGLEMSVRRQRFARMSGGSALEIVVLDDNDESRNGVLQALKEVMEKDSDIKGKEVEIDSPYVNSGYTVKIRRSLADVAGADGENIVSTIRTILNGQVIEEIVENNEPIDLILSLPEIVKRDIKQVLQFPISLNTGNTVLLSQFVETEPSSVVAIVYRERYRRVGRVYADIQDYSETKGDRQRASGKNKGNQERGSNRGGEEGSEKNNFQKAHSPALTPPEGWEKPTPLEIAERYEQEVFPVISDSYPSSIIYFDGEIKESRESQSSFQVAFVIVILSMFMVLALLFHSLVNPLIVMVIIPFGITGVVVAFYLHDINNYGFFSLLGFLGLSGVVVNDTIVMLSRFEDQIKNHYQDFHLGNYLETIANTAKTRLRAVIMTSITSVAGLFPTIYGWAGYDFLLAEMMFVMAWGLLFATMVTLVLLPSIYAIVIGWRLKNSP